MDSFVIRDLLVSVCTGWEGKKKKKTQETTITVLTHPQGENQQRFQSAEQRCCPTDNQDGFERGVIAMRRSVLFMMFQQEEQRTDCNRGSDPSSPGKRSRTAAAESAGLC